MVCLWPTVQGARDVDGAVNRERARADAQVSDKQIGDKDLVMTHFA